jgi:cellulose synthase (UDP-forming)
LALIGLNFLLLKYFNTLLWGYLWPQPGISILIGLFAAAVWYRELFHGIWRLRLVGLLMIFIGQSYLIHSIDVTFQDFSPVSVIHLIGFTGTFLVMTLNYVNQIMPKSNKKAPRLPNGLPYVAAVVPTYGEPCHILEKTVLYLKQLDYPAERLYLLISDDSHRDEVRRLADRHGVHYNPGAKRDAKAGNLNSALEHLDKHWPQATLILTQDADELVASSFLKKIVGYFEDPQIAFVQTPKEAFTPKGDPFGNRDRIFYDILQPGRNGSGAAFSCGSGVVWRIAAIKAIGGFSTWNLVEDMTTSYFLHCAGYRSEYHNEILTVGLSPDDIPGLLKQRGTWAADTWRFFLFHNPLWKAGHLSVRQRLQYLELGMFYMASAVFMPLLMFTPILSLATGDFIPIEGAALFPWIAISLLYYFVLAQGNLTFLRRMWQYWIGHWPTYTKALWIAVYSHHRKPSYRVTRKTRQDGFYGQLLWPQFLYLILGLSSIVYSLFWRPNVHPATLWTNIGILLFFMYLVSRICRTAFYGMDLNFIPGSTRSRQAWRQALALVSLTSWQLQPPETASQLPIHRTRPGLVTRSRWMIPMGVLVLVFLSAAGISGGLMTQNVPNLKASADQNLATPPVLSQNNNLLLPPAEAETAGLLPVVIASSPTPRPSPSPSPSPVPSSSPAPTPSPTSLRSRPHFSLLATKIQVPTATARPMLPTAPAPSPSPTAVLTRPPTIVPSPTLRPTPTMKYAAPTLLEPTYKFMFNAGNTLVLHWQPVGELAADEQYAVRLVYRFQDEVIYRGHQVKQPEWVVPPWLFSQVDGPAHNYDWFVFVERVNADGSTTMISPQSEIRNFTWR